MMTDSGLIALSLLLAATAAGADTWRMQKGESRLNFVPTFEGRPTLGQFRDFDVQLDFDPAHPEQGQLRVTVNIMSADLSSTDINEAIRAKEWLDVARYPEAQLVSTRIRGSGGRYEAEGSLRLKGTTRTIKVPFNWQGSGGAATMSGRLSLDRSDFRIGTGEWADGQTIAHPVEVRFDLRLERSH